MRIKGLKASILAAALTGSTAMAQQEAPKLARALRPINPASWLTRYGYPDLARRRGIQGVTTFSLAIDTEGKVSNCTIVISSGSELLDSATCRLLLQRAHFVAALGLNGKPIRAIYINRFRWML